MAIGIGVAMNIMSGESVDFSRTLLFVRGRMLVVVAGVTFFRFTPVVDNRLIVMDRFRTS